MSDFERSKLESADERKSNFERLKLESAKEWKEYRKPARARLAFAVSHLLETGKLQRGDIMAFGEVSLPQASLDIKCILANAPDLMTYDAAAKCYCLLVDPNQS